MFKDYSFITQSLASRLCISIHRKREDTKLKVLREELAALEAEDASTLHWRQRKGGVTFWAYLRGKQVGITGNMDRVYSLARKTYLKLRLYGLQHMDGDQWATEIEALLQSFASAGLDVLRIVLTKAQYEWASNPQSQKTNRKEQLEYKTDGGVYVRSKSERFIGNLLEKFGIPYRYEPELRIGNRTFHPDFVIMTTDGRLIILEHLGRTDLHNYLEDNVDRLAAYATQNRFIGRNVFLSFEADVKSVEAFMPIIHQIMAA